MSTIQPEHRPELLVSRVPAVDKCWKILGYVASHPGATIGELANSLGISKSTVSDIVQALTGANALIRGYTEPGLRLGPALIALGSLAQRQMPERRAMRNLLHELANTWNANVILAQLLQQSFTFVIVESIAAPDPSALLATVGTQLAFSAPAIGRAYLAGLSEAEAEQVLSRWRQHTAMEADLRAFLAPVPEARRLGFATTEGEYLPENNAVAAPVVDPRSRRVQYVLVLAGYPRQLPSERLRDAGQALRYATAQLSALGQF